MFVSTGGRADAGQEVTVWLGWSDALIRQEAIHKTILLREGRLHRKREDSGMKVWIERNRLRSLETLVPNQNDDYRFRQIRFMAF